MLDTLQLYIDWMLYLGMGIVALSGIVYSLTRSGAKAGKRAFGNILQLFIDLSLVVATLHKQIMKNRVVLASIGVCLLWRLAKGAQAIYLEAIHRIEYKEPLFGGWPFRNLKRTARMVRK
ncbi:MAG: hypothetical protein P4L46_22830 [Fimbriimonas sp.]|nr:hypothetical protein [Fimbriimonas sp.]